MFVIAGSSTRSSPIKSFDRRRVLLAGAALAALIAPECAYAQAASDSIATGAGSVANTVAEAPADATAASPVEEAEAPLQTDIVVTGSRTQSGFDAPTPTQIISGDTLERLQAGNAADVLNKLPAFKATASAEANGTKPSAPGVAQADLRGIGPNRTLVLLDGARLVPQVPSALTATVFQAPDLNNIPSIMIERMDVVTGGASAQWGSDAVSGVLNLFLRKRYDGLLFTAQSGISQYGDAQRVRLAALAGTDFLDDRLHLVTSAEYTRNKTIGDISARPWSRKNPGQIPNAAFATNGSPAIIFAENVHTRSTTGGVISGPANFSLRNFQFLSSNTLAPFATGQFAGSVYQIGGDGRSLQEGVWLTPSVERFSSAARLGFDVSDAVSVYLSGGYSWVKGKGRGSVTRDTDQTILRENAFLPSAVRNAMIAQNITSFTFNRLLHDVTGNSSPVVTNRTPRISGGFNAELGGNWKLDGHLAYSENHYKATMARNRIATRFAFARDAVFDGSGNIVCRATLPGTAFNPAAAGCVPINLFGEGSPSAAAINYVTGTSSTRTLYRQTAAALNISGSPFSTWAGPVQFAAGVEYRHETQDTRSDALSAANQFNLLNAGNFSGTFEVKEAYTEVTVPLLEDSSIGRTLDINGAVRVADYRLVGTETTWKVGAVYEPIQGLRFRATRSRDLRAPAIYELFNPGSTNQSSITVFNRTFNIPTTAGVGNINLVPEVGNTLSFGATINPAFAPRFKFSIDYYNIKITDAITTVLSNTVGLLCTAGQAFFCNSITFSPTDPTRPIALRSPIINAASIENDGIEFQMTYKLPVGSAGDKSLNFDLSGTYTRHVYVSFGNGAPTVDRAGENSNINNASLPRFVGNFRATYAAGPLELTPEVVYISKGKIDNTFNLTPATTSNINTVKAFAYLNLYANYDVSDRFTIFGAVKNVLNTSPPLIANPTIATFTNGVYYDMVGRFGQIGATVKF